MKSMILVLSLVLGTAHAAPFQDVLISPAKLTPLAARSLVTALARAGERLVAVGIRGHILLSDDGGANWRQVPAPVSVDLTSVRFADARHGWAVGHDGVILHSANGGETWTLQFDGKKAAQQVVLAYANQPALARQVEEAQAQLAKGADRPFLDIWFSDTREGYAVGAFGYLFRTTDGGRNWAPWMHQADNPRGLHLNAITAIDGQAWIVGEQGLVLAADNTGRFSPRSTPYQGSFFGLVGQGAQLLAFGLRGNAVISKDAGKTWQAMQLPTRGGLNGGALTADGRYVLVSQSGQVLVADSNLAFRAMPGVPPGLATSVLTGKGTVFVGGARGVRSLPLKE